jgi:hypothetical protein
MQIEWGSRNNEDVANAGTQKRESTQGTVDRSRSQPGKRGIGEVFPGPAGRWPRLS